MIRGGGAVGSARGFCGADGLVCWGTCWEGKGSEMPGLARAAGAEAVEEGGLAEGAC